MTFSMLNIPKTERSLVLFPFQSSLVEKSQLKSPSKIIHDDFNRAFSRHYSIRRKKSLSSGGLYMTENKTELFGNFTCSQIASRPLINKSLQC